MTENEIRELMSEFQREVYEFLPEAKFGQSSFWGGEDENSFGSAKMEFNLGQHAIRGSIYSPLFVRRYIHYTSFDALFQILNTEKIRMSDLNQLNDPREFDFLIRQYGLELDSEQINIFKRSLFLFSMCAFENDGDESFDMWRLYGQHGNGVAIVFDIENPEDNWNGYLLGRVEYGTRNAVVAPAQLVNIYNKYKQKGLNNDRMPYLLGALFLFHKSEIWRAEKEIRLVSFTHYNTDTLRIESLMGSTNFGSEEMFNFINSRGDVSAYRFIELGSLLASQSMKLNESDRVGVLSIKPRLRIQKIIVGYNVSDSYFDAVDRFLFRFNHDRAWKFIPLARSKYRSDFVR